MVFFANSPRSPGPVPAQRQSGTWKAPCTRKWQDKDGQDRYTTEIRADEMKMLGAVGAWGTDAPARNEGSYGGGGGSSALRELQWRAALALPHLKTTSGAVSVISTTVSI